MYSNPNVAVDKGLGFDFSAITDLVKSALPVGLNIFQQQQQLKAVKAGAPFVPTIGLPAAQMYGIQPTIPQPGYFPSVGGVSTTTMLAVGGAIVVGFVAYKMLK